jgi:predicted metal-dependent phosphoesterase TrpH
MDCNNILLDMHIHSRYSRDSILSLREIHACAKKERISPIICDHNSIQGSLKYQQMGYYHDESIPSIISAEIKTTQGEIIGLFLNEEIPPYQSPEETLDTILDQGGISIIPHPVDRYRKSAMKYEIITSLLPKIHALEVYNSRTLSNADISGAKKFAIEHGLLITGGSDAHCKWELFQTTIRIAPFDSPKEFLKNLRNANVLYKRSLPIYHTVSIITRKLRR